MCMTIHLSPPPCVCSSVRVCVFISACVIYYSYSACGLFLHTGQFTCLTAVSEGIHMRCDVTANERKQRNIQTDRQSRFSEPNTTIDISTAQHRRAVATAAIQNTHFSNWLRLEYIYEKFSFSWQFAIIHATDWTYCIFCEASCSHSLSFFRQLNGLSRRIRFSFMPKTANIFHSVSVMWVECLNVYKFFFKLNLWRDGKNKRKPVGCRTHTHITYVEIYLTLELWKRGKVFIA